MPRSRHAAIGLVAAAAIAACQGGNSLTVTGGNTAISGASASPGTSSSGISASGSTTIKPEDGSTFAVVVTNFPAATPVPTPDPPPMPNVLKVDISTESLSLKTPPHTAPTATWPGAGFPDRYQLVGMVRWSDGTYTTDVNWTSDNPALVGIDVNGWVWSTNPRTTGATKIWATARASASAKTSIPVTVVDYGKVQLDVY